MRVIRILAAIVVVLCLATASSAEAATLSGVVEGQRQGEAGTEPLGSVEVAVYPLGTEEPIAAVSTNEAGGYGLELESGIYDVRFDPGSSSSFEPTTVHEVEVTTSRALNVVLLTAKLVHLTGTLRDSEGEPVPFGELTLSDGTRSASSGTASGGAFDLAVSPGSEYTLYGRGSNGGVRGLADLPEDWYFQVRPLSLESDRTLELQLPPTHRLTIEVQDAEGQPIAGAAVRVPVMKTQADLGGGASTPYLESRGLSGTTGEDGRVSFTVFGGSAVNSTERIDVEPPAGSGYGATSFELPEVDGDTTLALSLQGGGEGSAEDRTAPEIGELTVEPSEVDTSSSSKVVLVTAHITDAGSGFSGGDIEFISPSGQHLSMTINAYDRVSGSPTDGIYRVPFTFAEGSEPGVWRIWGVRVVDAAGNQRLLVGEQVDEAGLQHPVAVLASPPVVTSLSPQAGPEAGGTQVEVSGTGLSSATEVRFGETSAEFSVDSSTSITATAPPGDGTVDVTVATQTGTSELTSADLFRYSPTVSLKSLHDPTVRGQTATFRATVTSRNEGAPTPEGTITFLDGTEALGTVDLNARGVALLRTKVLEVGEHEISAEYGGDSYFGPASSPPVVQHVAKAGTELVLKTSRNPAPYDSMTKLTARLKVVRPGSGVPGGSIIFFEDGSPVASVPLEGKRVATYSLKGHLPGTDEFQAVFSGDPSYEKSESTVLSQAITKATTELLLKSSRNPIPSGKSVTLTATLKVHSPGGGTPAGTVVLFEDGETLATLPLPSGKRVVRYSIEGHPYGTFEFSGSYDGDPEYAASSSAPILQLFSP